MKKPLEVCEASDSVFMTLVEVHWIMSWMKLLQVRCTIHQKSTQTTFH